MNQKSEENNKNPERLFYDNADMKRLFNFSDKTLQRMRKDKTIPFVIIGKKIFYPVEHFKKLAEQHKSS